MATYSSVVSVITENHINLRRMCTCEDTVYFSLHSPYPNPYLKSPKFLGKGEHTQKNSAVIYLLYS